MMTEAQKALQFARNHDWGQNAELVDGFITGLIDGWAVDGEYHYQTVTIVATMQAMRNFGGY